MSLQEIYAQYLSPSDIKTLQSSSDASSIAALLNQVISSLWDNRERLAGSNDRLVAELRMLSAGNCQLHDQLIQEKREKNHELALLNQKYRELLTMKENLVKLVEEKMELPVPNLDKETLATPVNLAQAGPEPDSSPSSKTEPPKIATLQDKVAQLELELNLANNELKRNRLFLMRALELSFPMRESLSASASASHSLNAALLSASVAAAAPLSPPDSHLGATEPSLRELAKELTYENQILQELLLDDHRKITALQDQSQSQALYSKQVESLKAENERLETLSAALQDRVTAMERSMLASVSTNTSGSGSEGISNSISSQQHLYEIIQRLTMKRQSQDQELQKLHAKVGHLSSQLHAAENQVSLSAAQLKSLQIQLDAPPLPAIQSSLVPGSDRWQAKCQQIWNAYDATSAAFLALQTQYTSLLSHLQSQDETIARLEAQISEHESNIIPLQYDHQRLASLEQEWADEKSELLNSLSAYIEKLAQKETALSTTQEALSHVRNENDGLKRTVALRQSSAPEPASGLQESKACLREFQVLNHSLYAKIESQRKRIAEVESELHVREQHLLEQAAKIDRLEAEQGSLKDMVLGLEKILESTRDEEMASQRVPSPIPPPNTSMAAKQEHEHGHEHHLGFDDSPEQKIFPVQNDSTIGTTRALLEEWRSGSQSMLDDLAAIRTRRQELSQSASLDSLQRVQLMIQEENVLLRHIVNQIKENLNQDRSRDAKTTLSYKEQTTF